MKYSVPVDEAVVLVEPGVVFVSTAVDVSVRVTDEEAARALAIPAHVHRYHLDGYLSGSGFAFSDGLIATAGRVVSPDEQERQRIMRYAVNRLLSNGDAGRLIGEHADPFDQNRTGDPALDDLLRQCYGGVACRFDIEPTVTVLTAARIASGSTTEGLAAHIVRYTGFEDTDVAILKVQVSGMPTVPLAASITDVERGRFVVTLGYPRLARDLPSIVTEPAKLLARVDIRTEGAAKVYETSASLTHGMSGGPTVDLEGRVVGLSVPAGHEHPGCHHAHLLPVDDIRRALRRAKVEAVRGAVDELFGQAMDHFWDRRYAAAVPLYRQVLGLHRGHPLAQWYLARAEANAGGPEEVPPSNGRFRYSGA